MLNNIFWANLNNLIFILPITIVAIVLIIKKIFWTYKNAKILAGKKNLKKFFINFSITKRIIKNILIMISFILISASLLRPQIEDKNNVDNQAARDLLIAIDISKSMLSQDVEPNRLEFSKNKIKYLINNLNSERIGLIVFSGDAFFQCPLTSDMAAVITFLNSIDTESISTGTTSLEAPIRKAIELFHSIEGKKNKLLVIFTDGEDFSENLENIKKESQDINLKIFTIGIGTQTGSPIPILDQNGKIKDYIKDKQNKIIISKLNEDTLKNLSKDTGAEYIKASQDNSDMDRLIKKVGEFEKEKIKNKSIKTLKEEYYYFALAGLICLFLEWVL